MKIIEYINSDYLNITNIIQLQKYCDYINNNKNIIKFNNNCDYLKTINNTISIIYSEDLIETQNINDIFLQLNNKIIILYNVDIDFPNPIKPYSYDKYFHEYILPENNDKIDYYDKINKDIINIIEKNNLHVFTYSASINNKNITYVPLGIFHQFNHFHLKTINKNILCYLNISIPCDRWFGNPRKKIIDYLQNKSFIYKQNNLSFDNFYSDIGRSKFAICPRGCGIDTYRLWDCIALGCIPIIEKYDSHNQWDDLPILFMDRIEDFDNINEDFLNKKYEEFLQKDFNYDKCKIDYWINKLEQFVI